jgi:hypothetical protein
MPPKCSCNRSPRVDRPSHRPTSEHTTAKSRQHHTALDNQTGRSGRLIRGLTPPPDNPLCSALGCRCLLDSRCQHGTQALTGGKQTPSTKATSCIARTQLSPPHALCTEAQAAVAYTQMQLQTAGVVSSLCLPSTCVQPPAQPHTSRCKQPSKNCSPEKPP